MSKPVTFDPTDEQRRRQYADEANENHRAAMDAEASALQYARAAGDALTSQTACTLWRLAGVVRRELQGVH